MPVTVSGEAIRHKKREGMNLIPSLPSLREANACNDDR